MADNSNSGQYQVSDPMGNSPSQTNDAGGATGVSTPPNNGDVTSIAPPPQEGASGAPLPSTGQPQPVNPSVQTQTPNAGQITQQAYTPAPAASMPDVSTNPLVRKASWYNAAATAMSGGPRVTTTVDPNTGQVTHTTERPSTRSLALVLAMEAMSGAFSGLANGRGPSGLGKAGAAGFQAGQQQAQAVQERNTAQDQQAKADAQLQQTTVANNLKLQSIGMQVGRQTMDDAQKLVDNNSDNWKFYQDHPDQVVSQGLNGDQAKQAILANHIGNVTAIPTGVHPRIDANGDPVFQLNGKIVPAGTPGAYQAPDFDWAVVKNTKVPVTGDDGKLNSKYQRAQSLGLVSIKDSNGRFPPNFMVDYRQDQTIGLKVASVDATQAEVNSSAQSLGIPPTNIDGDIKKNPGITKALDVFNSVVNQGGTYAQAQAEVAKTDKNAAGTIAGWFGGPKGISQLDQQRAATEQDNHHRYNGFGSEAEAQQALSSPSAAPDVKKSAQKYLDDITKQKIDLKRQEESITVGGQENLERYKANLTASAGGVNSPAANAEPNAQGVNTTFLATLPASQRAQVQAIGEGRQAPPSRGSKQGIALLDLVNTAYPRYNGANFATYQAAKTKATSGTTGQGITALSTSIDHVAEMIDNASELAVLPGAGFAARKGVFGHAAQQTAQNFDMAQTAAAEEVNKAIKGSALTQSQGEEALAKIHAWTPGEVKTKGVALLNLLKDRMDEQQNTLDQASVTGVAPFKLMSKKAQANYDRLTGQTGQQPQQGNQVVPPGAEPAFNKQGQTVGYRLNGQVTRF